MNTKKMFALGEVKSVEDETHPNGEFDVILSAPTLDRDGEVVEARVFEPLPDHITFDIDHGMSTATTVGSGTPFYDGDVLRVKGTYSSIPRAQEVRTLVGEGHIRTASVAFMGAVREEKDGVPHVVKAELLNGAFVPIPSNRESVVLSSKSYGERTYEAPVSRKNHGMTANEFSSALGSILRDAYGTEGQYVWVRDYSDEWVVFEIDTEESYACYQQSYSVEDGKMTLTEVPVEVVPQITYTIKSFPTAPVDPAKETGNPEKDPVDLAGNPPASEVVDGSAAVRVEAFLLTT